MNLKIKPLVPNFKAPQCAFWGSSTIIEFHSIEPGSVSPGEIARIPLGCAVAVPDGFALLISARQNDGATYGAGVPHGYSIITSDFRDELILRLCVEREMSWPEGEQICQGIIIPVISAHFELVKELPTLR